MSRDSATSADDESVPAVVRDVVSTMGGVDILVASGGREAPSTRTSDGDEEELLKAGRGLAESSDVRTFCRLCPSLCGIVVEVAGGRVIGVRGDTDHPIS